MSWFDESFVPLPKARARALRENAYVLLERCVCTNYRVRTLGEFVALSRHCRWAARGLRTRRHHVERTLARLDLEDATASGDAVVARSNGRTIATM